MKNATFLAFFTLFLMEVSILPVYLVPIWDGTGVSNIADYPYMCGIFSNLSEVPCGCAIISPGYALTGAHCFNVGEPDTIFIFFAGSVKYREGEVRIILKKEVIVHSNFNVSGSPVLTDSNLAIIKLNPPLIMTDSIKSIRLAERKDCKPGLATHHVITGWGSNSANGSHHENLLFGKARPVRLSSCEELFRLRGYDHTKHICTTKPSGACFGDYGGPLAVRKSNGFGLCGVIIIGHLDCSKKLTLYTRVSYYKDWICENTFNEPDACSDDFLRTIGAIGSALPVDYAKKLTNNQDNLRAIGATGNAQNLQNTNA